MNTTHEYCALTEALMNTVDALVVILEPDGTVREFNRACEAVTGYRAEEIVGRSIVDTVIPLEHRADAAKALPELSTPGTNRFENDWLTADGRRRRITWSNVAMRDEHGDVDRHSQGLPEPLDP